MEEDIKILESECYYLEELGYLRENNHFIRFNQALKNLIKAYKELEEENKDLKNLANNKQWISPCYVAQNYIPVSLVEEKIEELKQEGNYKTLENPDGRVHFQAEPCDYKIQVLEELLEKRK